jgi:hypothetical protein
MSFRNIFFPHALSCSGKIIFHLLLSHCTRTSKEYSLIFSDWFKCIINLKLDWKRLNIFINFKRNNSVFLNKSNLVDKTFQPSWVPSNLSVECNFVVLLLSVFSGKYSNDELLGSVTYKLIAKLITSFSLIYWIQSDLDFMNLYFMNFRNNEYIGGSQILGMGIT